MADEADLHSIPSSATWRKPSPLSVGQAESCSERVAATTAKAPRASVSGSFATQTARQTGSTRTHCDKS